MQRIKYAIKDFLGELQKKRHASYKNNPERLLKSALTKKELGHARFSYFKKGILGIEVDSSSRLYLLTLRKEAMLEKLRKRSDKVRDIRFRLGVSQ